MHLKNWKRKRFKIVKKSKEDLLLNLNIFIIKLIPNFFKS